MHAKIIFNLKKKLNTVARINYHNQSILVNPCAPKDDFQHF